MNVNQFWYAKCSAIGFFAGIIFPVPQWIYKIIIIIEPKSFDFLWTLLGLHTFFYFYFIYGVKFRSGFGAIAETKRPPAPIPNFPLIVVLISVHFHKYVFGIGVDFRHWTWCSMWRRCLWWSTWILIFRSKKQNIFEKEKKVRKSVISIQTKLTFLLSFPFFSSSFDSLFFVGNFFSSFHVIEILN